VTLPDGRSASIDCDLARLTIELPALERPALDIVTESGTSPSSPSIGRLPDPSDLAGLPALPRYPTIDQPTPQDTEVITIENLPLNPLLPEVELIFPDEDSVPVQEDTVTVDEAPETTDAAGTVPTDEVPVDGLADDGSMDDSPLPGVDIAGTAPSATPVSEALAPQSGAAEAVTVDAAVPDAGPRSGSDPLPDTGSAIAGLLVGLGLTGVGGGALARLAALRRRR
jgi:hypothetical protein